MDPETSNFIFSENIKPSNGSYELSRGATDLRLGGKSSPGHPASVSGGSGGGSGWF